MSRRNYEIRHTPIWERQPQEDDTAWLQFQEYIAQPLPRKTTVVKGARNYAAYHHWVKRGLAWDNHLNKAATAGAKQAVREDAREMASRHLAASRRMQRLAMQELDKLIRMSSDLEEAILTPGVILKIVESLTKLDRLVSDQSTEHTATSDSVVTGPDLKSFSVDELKQWRALMNKAKT